ncbi:UNVERIFIED_CONTAM: hypothetical protein HDU68_005996, partial [Siphonaria sp. JEL0065]
FKFRSKSKDPRLQMQEQDRHKQSSEPLPGSPRPAQVASARDQGQDMTSDHPTSEDTAAVQVSEMV